MTPERVHEIYLETALKRGCTVKPENDKPYAELSEDSQAIEVGIADACNKELDDNSKQAIRECAAWLIMRSALLAERSTFYKEASHDLLLDSRDLRARLTPEKSHVGEPPGEGESAPAPAQAATEGN